MEQSNIVSIAVECYRVPTPTPESDGTLEWDHTNCIVVRLCTSKHEGLGYTYADVATAHFIQEHLSAIILNSNAIDIAARLKAHRAIARNMGQFGIAAMAISAIDVALWDLKCKIFNLPLCDLLGRSHAVRDLYGSGGFTSMSVDAIEEQFSQWAELGIQSFKMKVGRNPEGDLTRVRSLRKRFPRAALFVDANGAYSRIQAKFFCKAYADLEVSWFEEPVDTFDTEGMRQLKSFAPLPIQIAGGEYGYSPRYFNDYLNMQCVHCLQADATRCLGYSGLLEIDTIAKNHNIPLSTHCAPSLHAAIACSLESLIHLEFFADHERIEKILFYGFPKIEMGHIQGNRKRPGHGLELRSDIDKKFCVFSTKVSL